ncbi:hypothetical protein LOTGIDRAFT_235483 [Lottia gigantea]|uniref:Sushi domain-containing protein n=1 Tax=Lottia gigantea TaxID=225164 RepID=V4BB69_LOTGI|nr:hypothetical protein LOTGIDRAFT_235483 [Lottia gigantea]ESO86244.1 hypothetical protein LOTGIDRAFT_235483 [Lottia gigantea]
MMVKANLMLVVVMLWTGSLTLASPRQQPNTMRGFWEKSVCDKYNLIENAVWIPRETCEDNKRFACKIGYQLQIQTSCTNGKWSSEPSCQAVRCPLGEEIENSVDLTPSGISGEDYDFNCLTGYTRRGLNGTLTCGENGDWMTKTPCEAVRCPLGEEIENSVDLTPSGISGEDYDFNCLTGYTRRGLNGTLTCGENGDWMTKTPCEDCIKYYNGTIVIVGTIFSPSPFGRPTDVEGCNELCSNTSQCNYANLFRQDYCVLFRSPVIFASDDYDLDQCMKQCNEMSECVTMSSDKLNIRTGGQLCYLFKVPLNEIPDDWKLLAGKGTTLTEKIC